MKIHSFFPGVIFIFLTAFHCQAQSTTPLSPEVLKKIQEIENNLSGPIRIAGDKPWYIMDRMNFYKIKGVSIAVIHNYKVEWAKGYGLSDDSSKTAVTIQTLFQAASISKSLNGVGVLKLAQENKLDLNADINQYLTSWKFPYDSASGTKKITTLNLLSHTAGLTVHGFRGYSRNEKLPTLIQILNGTPPANSAAIRSMYAPGIKAEYSGGGITISQLLVQDIVHTSYAQYINEEILKPLGMESSSFTQPNPGNPLLLATGYRMNGDEVQGKYNIYPEEAAAGLWTNPTDLGKYIIETQLSLEGKSKKVLEQKMTRLRLTPYLDKEAALGVFIKVKDSTSYFTHDGANEGFRCQYFGSLEGGNGFVIMVNSDNGTIIPEIENSIAKTYNLKGLFSTKIKKIVTVDSVVLNSYTGEYKLNQQLMLTVTREKDKLFIQGTNQPRFQVFAESQNTFFVTSFDAEIEFAKDEKGKLTKMILSQNGMKFDAPKIK